MPKSPLPKGLPLLLCCAFWLACLGQDHQQNAPEFEPATNVVLISIDTLRPDHLGCYGYERDTSPTIDRLAAEGVVFENHVSSTSWTLPAHAALFTSLPDSVHGCIDTNRRLGENLPTLAETFKAEGYSTAGFFSGPYLHPAFGLGQGFDIYRDCTAYGGALDDRNPETWAMDEGIMRQSHQDVTNPRVTTAVVEWLAEAEEPFFLFIHLWDVHFDFIPPEPYDRLFDADYEGWVDGKGVFFDDRITASMAPRDLEHLIALYDGEIRWTDDHVKLIVDTLQQQQILDTTVVALTSDHGTEFFEHGDKFHRKTLFDEVILTPLIIRYPSAIPADKRILQQTRIIDVAPTLLHLTGLESNEYFSGESLIPLATGEVDEGPGIAISELFSVGRNLRSARTAKWKILHDLGRRLLIRFDLDRDPNEQDPLIDWEDPDLFPILSAYFEIVKDLQAKAPKHSPSEIPQRVQDQLRSLGYIEASENGEGRRPTQ